MPKINQLLKLLFEADGVEESIRGYNHIFECIDYLSKTSYNKSKSFVKKLQRINDNAMYQQSLYNLFKGG